VAAGHPDRALGMLHQLADFATIPRDVDWLLTVYLLTDVAAAVDEPAQAEAGLDLLTPYAGRGVIDAGGVAFAGVVDAALARASAALNRPEDAARWSASAEAAYRRIGATWLLHTLAVAPAPLPSPPIRTLNTPGGAPAGRSSSSIEAPSDTPQASPPIGAPDGVPEWRASPPIGAPDGVPEWRASPSIGAPGGTPTWQASPPVEVPGDPPARQASAPVGAHGESAGGHAASASEPPAVHSARAEPRVLHLRLGDDGIWRVGHDDGPSAMRDMRGLRYLHLLLSRPGLDVPALELSDAVAGNVAARAVDGDAGPLLDRQALAAYRRRLSELDDDLAEARAHADLAREERLDREREALLDQVRAATGLGGRARLAGGTHERARVAVRKAIAAAIDRIAALDPSLGRLLGDTVTTGANCRYDPDPDRPVRWIL
jgi:hypothetical protein